MKPARIKGGKKLTPLEWFRVKWKRCDDKYMGVIASCIPIFAMLITVYLAIMGILIYRTIVV